MIEWKRMSRNAGSTLSLLMLETAMAATTTMGFLEWQVVIEMARAKEMGIRHKSLPWRYCMAEPMSSSMGLATWCSVTVRLSFDVVVCVHFHLTHDLWTTYDTVVLILASTSTRWTRNDDITAEIREGNTVSWFCRGHQLWVGASVSFSPAIRGEGKWRSFNGYLAFWWRRRRFAVGGKPPASFEDSFACFILCKFSLEDLGE